MVEKSMVCECLTAVERQRQWRTIVGKKGMEVKGKGGGREKKIKGRLARERGGKLLVMKGGETRGGRKFKTSTHTVNHNHLILHT